MTDKIKEIAEKLWNEHSRYTEGTIEMMGHENFHTAVKDALTEYESSEIARLLGIIERAKKVAFVNNGDGYSDIYKILSEAEEQ